MEHKKNLRARDYILPVLCIGFLMALYFGPLFSESFAGFLTQSPKKSDAFNSQTIR